MLRILKTLMISPGGEVRVPAAVRRRWKTRFLVAEDRGDHLVLRPDPEGSIERARGAFKDSSGPSTDEMTRMNREEEREIEERKYGPDPD